MQDNKVRVIFEAVLKNFTKDVKGAAKATLEIGDAGEKASRKANFDESTKSVNRFDDGLKKVEKTLKTLVVGYLGKKLFDAGKENFKFFEEYQKELTKIFTLLPDITEQGMERMSDDVKQFAKDMKVLPAEVLPALYEAISASVPEAEVFDFLKTAREASVGGATEMGTSVDVLTSVVNAYGGEVINAQRTSDLLFAAMRNGKTSFEELANNMYSVLPAAKSLDVPFENVTGALATMTAMGTPTAQSTTQLGRMFLEFSKDGTTASEIFYKATKKTFKQYIAEGNNLQDVLRVMEGVAKKSGLEINNLFSSAEAGNAALALTGRGAEKFSSDLEAMADSAGATGAAYEKMSGTISFVLDGIRAKIAVFKLDIADRYFPQIEEAIGNVDATLDRLEQNGALDRLAQSIGGIIATIITEFDKWLNNIDAIIEGINRLAAFIENNLGTAITVVRRLAEAFLFFKTAAAVATVIEGVVGAIGLLTGSQWALNAAMNANPIGIIITLVGLLLLGIIKLTGGFENFKIVFLMGIEVIKLAFLGWIKMQTWGINLVISLLDKLLGWIPLIGDAFNLAANVSQNAMDGLNRAIDNSIAKIDELNSKRIAPKIDTSAEMTPEDEKLALINHRKTSAPKVSTPTYNAPKVSTGGKSGKAGTTSTKKKTIHDRIRDVDDKHSPDIDVYESRARLAEAKDDTSAAKANKKSIVEVLRKQASDLLSLQNKSKGQDAKIVEAARNKVLLKIKETLKDINEGVSKLVGDFNVPSELKALTEYQYKVERSDNKLSKRLIYSPNVDMYLTIADTKGKGASQVRQEIEGFTSAIFDDKNDLVTKFMQDVTRN